METQELTGRIYDIQGFSIQDGPGIRTTAFLKGCPLRCPWCHSPESQLFSKQLSWISMRCEGTAACRERCLKACDKNALEYGPSRIDIQTKKALRLVHVKRDLCDNCGKCADACYPNALTLTGTDYTADELVSILLKDRLFFETSGGGVTISGGEALSQPEFTLAVLKKLKEEGIHTAVDTTGYAKWEVVESVLPYTDLFLYDIKHMNSGRHKQAVGVPNELILNNAKRLALAGGKLQIRIPVIPMFNDDVDNIRKTAEFCKVLGHAVEVVQLLPYHNLGAMKYLRISDNPAVEAFPPSDEHMQMLKEIIEEYGLNVMIH